MQGVLDRFEGNQAVILIEAEKKEIVVAKEALPKNSDVNTWFDISKQENDYILTINTEKTNLKMKKSTDLAAKLRVKSKGSKFKKK